MLKEIKGTILKEAKKEGEGALQQAEGQLEAEFAAVRRDGEAMVKLAEQEARRLVESERRERLSWAKLEAKRILSEAREDAANAALEALIDELKGYTKSRAYSDRMKKLVSRSVPELGGKAVIHVRKGDRKIFALPNATVMEDANVIGGAILESKDGRLRVDLSLEALMDANKDLLRKDIYALLFSAESGGKQGRRK